MKEQVINSLRHVGKCNPACYPLMQMTSWHVSTSNDEANFVQITRIQRFLKTFGPYHVGIHWISLAEYSQLSTHVLGFRSFSGFLHLCILAKLTTGNIRVKFPSYLG